MRVPGSRFRFETSARILSRSKRWLEAGAEFRFEVVDEPAVFAFDLTARSVRSASPNAALVAGGSAECSGEQQVAAATTLSQLDDIACLEVGKRLSASRVQLQLAEIELVEEEVADELTLKADVEPRAGAQVQVLGFRAELVAIGGAARRGC